nr:7,8-didemethyl-8-hydroxy-5-deazariboflavin synthase subunit CofG [Spirulina major]
MKSKKQAINRITYSPAYTLVPTYECFNRCDYCNFRVDPGGNQWLSVEVARDRLLTLPAQGVIEILILSGEVHPRSDRRSAWLDRIYDLCELALDLGFLPHSNVGILSEAEMVRLKAVNVSMGLMLEQITPRLQQTRHRHAPSKDPATRLRHLDTAGRLQIPFTTGLLLGIGETEADWRETLAAIATSHYQWGHIQEVILQPYNPGSGETYRGLGISGAQMIRAVELAREMLPPDVQIQIPPNLIDTPDTLLACLAAGARDLGGIGPIDEVNPDYRHQQLDDLRELLARNGWHLTRRLPLYPEGDRCLPNSLKPAVTRWRGAIAEDQLDASYQLMADDQEREIETFAWAEALIGDSET